MRTGTRRRPKPPPQCTAEPHPAQQYIWCCPNSSTSMKRAPHLLPPRAVAAPGGSGFESRPSRSERDDLGAPRARARPRQDETRRDVRREGEVDVDVLPQRPRRELASVLAPTQRRAPPREMAPPRGRRRDQPRASSGRCSAAAMRCDVPALARKSLKKLAFDVMKQADTRSIALGPRVFFRSHTL